MDQYEREEMQLEEDLAMDRLEELEVERARIFKEINAIEAEQTDRENAALVGKCYRFRNCYSCPETDADYWWLYIKVLRAEDGSLRSFRFQTDSEGGIRIEPDQFEGDMSGHQEISEKEFNAAWGNLMDRLKDKFPEHKEK